MISEKNLVSAAKYISKHAQILAIKTKHATTNNAETSGILEMTQASSKTYLNYFSDKCCEQWHKYLLLAVRTVALLHNLPH